MMKMSELANLLVNAIAEVGDREIGFVEEGTGEVRYLVGLSISQSDAMLEHVSYGEMQMIKQLDRLGVMMDEAGDVSLPDLFNLMGDLLDE
jgi:hypothetical protein